MTYPQTILTRPIRRGLMIFLICLFFLLSPVIILYTGGYRYDFQTGGIKQTGVISIDVEPTNASVFLNGVKLDKKIPIRLSNRASGNYHLKIEALGYKNWEKDIVVESRQTTYIRDIVLFSDSLPENILKNSNDEIQEIFFSNDGKYALVLKTKENIYQLDLFDTQTESTTPLLRTYTDKPPQISWSPFYPVALIYNRTSTRTQVQLLDAKKTELNGKIFTFDIIQEPIFQWKDSTSNPSLYLQTNLGITEITLSNYNIKYQLPDSKLWYVENNNLWLYDPNKKTIVLDRGEEEYNINELLEKIININGERIIAKTKTDFLITLRKKGADSNLIKTEDVIFNQSSKEWLSWSPWELWTIYPDGNTELLNRTGEAIQSPAPLDKFGLILLSTNTSLLGFNPGYYVTHELLSGAVIKKVAVDIDNRQIYFWGEVGRETGLFGLKY